MKSLLIHASSLDEGDIVEDYGRVHTVEFFESDGVVQVDFWNEEGELTKNFEFSFSSLLPVLRPEAIFCQGCHACVDIDWTEELTGVGVVCIDCSEHIYEASQN